MRKITAWQPAVQLTYHFVPTRYDSTKELSKARVKNHNLLIIQYMYNGDETIPLKCMLTGALAWVEVPCFLTNQPKTRFNIDFNHIRQRASGKAQAGNSVDKDSYDPSSVFRGTYLDKDIGRLAEFMCILPVTQEYHSYITQDSAIGDITLNSFPKTSWPWILQNKTNFDQFCKKYNFKHFTYDWLIDHLTNIGYPPIAQRLASTLGMDLSPKPSFSKFKVCNYRKQNSMFEVLFKE